MNIKPTIIIILLLISLAIIPIVAASNEWGINTNDWAQFRTNPTVTPYPTASPTPTPTTTTTPTSTTNPVTQPTTQPSNQSTPNSTIPETNLTITIIFLTTIIIALTLIKIKGKQKLPTKAFYALNVPQPSLQTHD
jgi:hypothetical protein